MKAQEPVAIVGDVYQLLWFGSSPIAQITRKHGIKVGSKLYANPLPPNDVVRDAERYRFLRDEACLVNPIVAVVWKRNDDRNESEWVNTVDSYSLDCHIDAAMEEVK